MRPSLTVDTSKLKEALRAVVMSPANLLTIEGAAAKVVVNIERQLVPVDTSATQNSINSHIEEATLLRVVDEIGPETIYAPSIEYGIEKKPNYPIQPFIRPAAVAAVPGVVKVIGTMFGQMVVAKWPT